jgi:hypothetical protein
MEGGVFMSILGRDELQEKIREMRSSGALSQETLEEMDKFLTDLGELSKASAQVDKAPLYHSIRLCMVHGGFGLQSDCFVCRKEFGPNLTALIDLLEDQIRNHHLTGCGGHNFVDREVRGKTIKANSTPAFYAVATAVQCKASVEEVAEELLQLHTAMKNGEGTPIYECRGCLTFVPKAKRAYHETCCVPLPGRTA